MLSIQNCECRVPGDHKNEIKNIQKKKQENKDSKNSPAFSVAVFVLCVVGVWACKKV